MKTKKDIIAIYIKEDIIKHIAYCGENEKLNYGTFSIYNFYHEYNFPLKIPEDKYYRNRVDKLHGKHISIFKQMIETKDANLYNIV